MRHPLRLLLALAIFVLTIGLVWYNHLYFRYGYPFRIMASGLAYKPMRSGTGRKVQKGEWMLLSFELMLGGKNQDQLKHDKPASREKLISESNVVLAFDDRLEREVKQIAEMIAMVEERQRVMFKFSPQYFWKDKSSAHIEAMLNVLHLKTDDELVMDIKLDQIMTKEEAAQMMAERRAEQLAKQTAQLAKDKELISAYLATHSIQACSTDSGLFYIIDQASEDIPIVQHKTVKIHYTGKFLDGTVFDTSVEEVAKANGLPIQNVYKPLEFSVGVGRVIPGWDEGLCLLKKNEKARFFIPSALAYGTKGCGGRIPANAILLFEVEVVDVN